MLIYKHMPRIIEMAKRKKSWGFVEDLLSFVRNKKKLGARLSEVEEKEEDSSLKTESNMQSFDLSERPQSSPV